MAMKTTIHGVMSLHKIIPIIHICLNNIKKLGSSNFSFVYMQ